MRASADGMPDELLVDASAAHGPDESNRGGVLEARGPGVVAAGIVSVGNGTWVRFAEGGSLVGGGTTVGRGRLVYSSWVTMRRLGVTDGNVCGYNDFALVRVGRAHLGKVNPTVPFWGGPVGLHRGATDVGDTVYSFGNSSLRGGATVLAPKQGDSPTNPQMAHRGLDRILPVVVLRVVTHQKSRFLTSRALVVMNCLRRSTFSPISTLMISSALATPLVVSSLTMTIVRASRSASPEPPE